MLNVILKLFFMKRQSSVEQMENDKEVDRLVEEMNIRRAKLPYFY
jgi:hypothetical protein